MPFSEHPHESRFEMLISEVRRADKEPSIPPEIEHLLTGQSYVGACQGFALPRPWGGPGPDDHRTARA
jgi:hypothetical protein